MQMSCERVCMLVSVYVVVVWQDPKEEQFVYLMDFTLYKYIWNKKMISQIPPPFMDILMASF